MYLWLWCHCLPLTIAPSSLTQDSMGQHGPCPNPRPTPGSWCPTPDTSRHHHSHTRVTRTHCWMQYDYDNLHVQNICFEWYQYLILKASLSFLVLVFLPSPVLPSPQWRHQSQSEAATRPGCPSVCWPTAPGHWAQLSGGSVVWPTLFLILKSLLRLQMIGFQLITSFRLYPIIRRWYFLFFLHFS